MSAQPTSQKALVTGLTARMLPPRNFGWQQLLPLLPVIGLFGLLVESDRVALLMTIQGFTQLFSDTFWSAVTLLGHSCIALALFALCWRNRPDLITAALCATPIAGLFSCGLKKLIGGPRPAAIMPVADLHVVGERLLGNSFPSGHTVTAFVLAGILLLSGRLTRVQNGLIGLLACAVGLSRMAVGAHWPLDVIAGAGIGWLSAICSLSLSRQVTALNTLPAQRVAALVVIAASASLLFTQCGYPLAVGLQYGSALVGMACCMFWLRRVHR